MDVKAKDMSLLAKIIAVAIMIIGSGLKWMGVMPNCEIQELTVVAFTVMGLFGTVDINLMLEKFSKKKAENE